MHLKLLPPLGEGHSALACTITWSSSGEIFSAGDDAAVKRWGARGEACGKLAVLAASIVAIDCCPSTAGRRQQSPGTHILAVACTDGTLKLLGGNGRVDKSIEAHSGAVLAVRWSPDGTALASAGEDGAVRVWSPMGMPRSTLVQLEDPTRCLAWGGAAAGSQLLVCSGGDVVVRSLQGLGGSAAATSAAVPGTPAGTGAAAAAAAVSAASSIGKHLIVPAAAPTFGVTQAHWRAHEGLVLAADWCSTNSLIATCGEDYKFKIWDALGRQLHVSSPGEYPLTSLAWAPDGEVLAVGGHERLALYDRRGWAHCQVQAASAGSLLDLAWSPDGTSVAAACGSGAVLLAALLGLAAEDGRHVAVLESERHVSVTDVASGIREELDFKDPVLHLSLGWGRLVIATANQVHVFSAPHWATPAIADVRETSVLLLQCERAIALVDCCGTVSVFTYEGRPLSSLRPPGLLASRPGRHALSLASDTLAVAAGTSVTCFEIPQGQPLGGSYTHSCPVKAISLSQSGTASDRLLALLDVAGDLILLRPALLTAAAAAGAAGAVQQQPCLARPPPGALSPPPCPGHAAAMNKAATPCSAIKLAAGVSAPPVWHSGAPMLAAILDGGQLVILLHPAAAFTDTGLQQVARHVLTDSLGPAGVTIELFAGAVLLLRRGDGARMHVAASPQPALLHMLAKQGQWDRAMKLARLTGDAALWGCLAALAAAAGELAAAEVAYAAMGSVDRLQWMKHLQSIAAAGGGGGARTGGSGSAAAAAARLAAELALSRQQPEEAEAVLLQAGLVYRAIKLHVRRHAWARALELAQHHGGAHIDTVRLYRRRFLSAAGLSETLSGFVALKDTAINEAAVRERVAADKALEAAH